MLELRQAWRISIPFNFGKFCIWAPQKTANILRPVSQRTSFQTWEAIISFLYVMFTIFTQKWLRLLIKTFSFVNVRQISTGFSTYWRQSRRRYVQISCVFNQVSLNWPPHLTVSYRTVIEDLVNEERWSELWDITGITQIRLPTERKKQQKTTRNT